MTALRRMAAGSLLLVVVALTACSDDKSSSPTTANTQPPAQSDAAPPAAADTSAATGAADALVIQDFAFGEFSPTAGQPFAVQNKDGATHTVTADDGSFTVRVGGGETGELTIAAAGTYAIHCDVHPRMTGSLTVT